MKTKKILKMTNEEKRQYIRTLAEYNRQCYNNGETDNIIGMYESKWQQMLLKIYLLFKYPQYKGAKKQ